MFDKQVIFVRHANCQPFYECSYRAVFVPATGDIINFKYVSGGGMLTSYKGTVIARECFLERKEVILTVEEIHA